MAKIDSKSIEEYQKALAADPNSKVFAVLGQAYLELGIIEQAENILRRGITKHPNYAAGFLVLSKIHLQKKDHLGALKLLQRAVELSPDNLMAFQLLGETHLQMKNPKDALKAYKMALFLNPSHERAKQVVKSLEQVSADEYEEDLFAMKAPGMSLPETEEVSSSTKTSTAARSASTSEVNFERSLSLVDALIVRQQADLARQKLVELQKRHPGHPEIQSRLKMLEASHEIEEAQPILPLAQREKRVIMEKIQRLQRVLKTIENRQDPSL